MGSATAITRFVSFLSAFEFPFIAAMYGVNDFFLILLGVVLIALIITILFTPETKGMTLDEISRSIYMHGKLVPRINDFGKDSGKEKKDE
jgi:putative MFS transporter